MSSMSSVTDIWWVKDEDSAEVKASLLYRIQCELDPATAAGLLTDLAEQLQDEMPGGVLVASLMDGREVGRLAMEGAELVTRSGNVCLPGKAARWNRGERASRSQRPTAKDSPLKKKRGRKESAKVAEVAMATAVAALDWGQKIDAAAG